MSRRRTVLLSALAILLLALPTAAMAASPPKSTSSEVAVNSSFTSSAPSIDGVLQPAASGGPPYDGGSTPWPFTAPNEWSAAAKYGLFSDANKGVSEPPWSSLQNEMFFPNINQWGSLTIPASGANPSSPPWAPSWLFIMNDANYLYLLVEINPANKACFQCPSGTGPSDKAIFYFETNNGAVYNKADVISYTWAFGATSNSPDVVAISCTTPYPTGDCPSPTVYEARIPLSDLGCASLPCNVGIWVDAHASPHGATIPPPPTTSVPEFSVPVAVAAALLLLLAYQGVRRRRGGLPALRGGRARAQQWGARRPTRRRRARGCW